MINVAVVGMGWWGKTVVNLIQKSSKLRVVAGMNLNAKLDEDFAREHGFHMVSDYAQVLADPRVEAVILCTPHSLHKDQIIAAARANKHVFCEKPLAMTRDDVEQALEVINAHHLQIAVGHERRFEPPIQELMRRLKLGLLGVPLHIEANFSQDKFLTLPLDNWRLSAKEAPGGPLTATGIHILDLSISVFGEAEKLWCSVKQLGSQLVNGDTLSAMVQFKQGGHALLTAILATPFDGRFAVYGTKGWIEVRDKAHPGTPEGWTLTQVLSGGEKTRIEYEPCSSVLVNLEAFADAIDQRAPYPVPQTQMIANIAAMEAMIRSAATGEIVSL